MWPTGGLGVCFPQHHLLRTICAINIVHSYPEENSTHAIHSPHLTYGLPHSNCWICSPWSHQMKRIPLTKTSEILMVVFENSETVTSISGNQLNQEEPNKSWFWLRTYERIFQRALTYCTSALSNGRKRNSTFDLSEFVMWGWAAQKGYRVSAFLMFVKILSSRYVASETLSSSF